MNNSDAGPAYAPGTNPSPSPAPRNNGSRIAAAVALIGAFAGVVGALNKDAFWTFLNGQLGGGPTQKKFDDAYTGVLALLRATPPPTPQVVRESVGMAYGYAPSSDAKCKVVDIVINYGDQTVSAQMVPVGFARDVEKGTLPGSCADDLRKLAALYKSKGAYVSTGSAGLSSDDSAKLNAAADKLIASGTDSGVEGWIYVGRSRGHGGKIDPSTWMIKEPRAAAKGRITTTRELALHSLIPSASEDRDDRTVGRALAGAVLDVLEVRDIAEAVAPGSPQAGYTWARVKLVSQGGPQTSFRAPRRRELARAIRRPAFLFAVAGGCTPFSETNSRHGPAQRWIYVGQKVYGDDAFVPGTSLLDTPCVPRDGSVARVLQQAPVLIGPDPHYPGVKANGQSLVAGTTIQVVGDVSGYPFDSVADPSFCSREPQPRRTDPAVTTGHQKRYCVYVPFIPI